MNVIYRKFRLEVTPTPQELAACFCNMDADQQAEFFNSIANVTAGWDRPIDFQLQAVTDSYKLKTDGRRIMRKIGEYADAVKMG